MENVKELIELNYPVKVIQTEKIKNVYKIKTEAGYKCLKLSKYDSGQFNFIMKAIHYLLDKGYDPVLPLYPTIGGKDYIKYDEGYAYMCDWIDSREANFKNPVELKFCIDTLSSLHVISRGFEPPAETKGRNYYGKWVKKFQKRCDELVYFKALIKSKEQVSEFDKLYLKYFDIHYRQALKSINDIEGSNYFSIMGDHSKLSSICHHDTANHNFLITADLKMYMIDFDYCILDSHIHDLGSIIIRNLKYGHWNPYTMEYILDIYSSRIPISKEERYLIFCFIEFPQDFWQVGLQYYVEKQPWGEEFFIKKLTRIVEDSRERIDFIKELESSFVGGV